jgi:hypothetical protein
LSGGLFLLEEADCIIAATVLFSYLRVYVCLFSVLVFIFFFFSKTAIWVGLAGRNGFGMFFTSYPQLFAKERKGMGKTEAQDVDRT